MVAKDARPFELPQPQWSERGDAASMRAFQLTPWLPFKMNGAVDAQFPKSASRSQSKPHPSPASVLPSSQYSPLSRKPSPHVPATWPPPPPQSPPEPPPEADELEAVTTDALCVEALWPSTPPSPFSPPHPASPTSSDVQAAVTGKSSIPKSRLHAGKRKNRQSPVYPIRIRAMPNHVQMACQRCPRAHTPCITSFFSSRYSSAGHPHRVPQAVPAAACAHPAAQISNRSLDQTGQVRLAAKEPARGCASGDAAIGSKRASQKRTFC